MKRFSLVLLNYKKSPFILATLFILLYSCNSINESVFDDRPDEGVIKYNVSFPLLGEESITASLLPEEMTLYFKNDDITSEFETIGGVFKNKLISNAKNRELYHELKVFRKKIKVDMDMEDIGLMMSSFPAMTLIKTNQTDSIAGYLCKKAIAVYADVGRKESIIWYTEDIKVQNPNWYNQFYEIDGVLMEYEFEQLGITMHLRASEVSSVPIKKDIFKPEKDYKNISMEMMQIELTQLMETFEM